MSDSGNVQFEDSSVVPEYRSHEILGPYQNPGIILRLKRWGVVKTDRQAHWLIILFIVVCFSLSVFIFLYASGYLKNFTNKPLTIDQMLQQGKISKEAAELMKKYDSVTPQ